MERERIIFGVISVVLVVFSEISSTTGQVCGADPGREAGLDASHAINTDVDLGGGVTRTYIMADKGGVNCFGVVKEFHLEHGTGICQEVTFQMWRPNGGSYRLIGEYEYDGANDRRCTDPQGAGPHTLVVLIPVSQQIPIEPDDVIGWKETDVLMLMHTTAGGAGNVLYHDGCDGVTPGNTCNPVLTLGQDHAIRAIIVTGPPPSIDNLPGSVEIYENGVDVAILDIIFIVTASHQNNYPGNSNTWEPVAITYSMDPTYAAEFQIDPLTGEVDVRVDFDYEVQTSYDVIVYVDAQGQQVSEVLTVSILDIQEPHIIQNLDHAMSVSAQTTTTGDLIYTVVSVDPITLAVVPVSYVIESGLCGTILAPFDIGRTTGEVTCNQDLSDWRRGNCVLDIASVDLINRVTGTLTITITDIKARPIILYLPQSIQLSEDVNGNTVIYNVEVDYVDQDQLHHAITNVGPATNTYLYNFEINSQNGEISVVADPTFDFFVDATYDIDIEVTNQFGQADQALLTVSMVWANRPPLYQPEVYQLIMDEECDNNVGTCFTGGVGVLPLVVLNLNARDRDVEQATDTLSCDIIPSFGSNMFDIGNCLPTGNQVELSLIGRIDVDADPHYMNFDLIAKVEDASGESNIATIHVTVNDINDNTPVFSSPPYGATIFENVPGGVYLFTVGATDLDSGVNGVFTFAIRDIAGQARGSFYFQVDPITGVVTTKHPVDYEMYTSIDFDITATDKGAPANTGVTLATVVIVDVNDNRPEFVCSPRPADEPYDADPACFYNLELRSDVLVGYEVIQMTATDEDQDVTPHYITYELIKPVDHFVLVETDGWVVVSKAMHDSHKYLLYCFAHDNGIPNLMSEPLVVRIDSFKGKKHLIDIVLEIPEGSYDDPAMQDGFIGELRTLLDPWFVKMERYTIDIDKTTVTIYALCETSTYSYLNVDKGKCFVHRNDLLDKTRKNILGDPHDDLLTEPFDPYNPILVEPTHPIWIIDTIPGIITLCLICLVVLIIIIAIILCICKKAQVCCFKPKPPPSEHNWPDQNQPDMTSPDDMEMEPPSEQRSQTRRPSVDTIHSLIYDPYKHKAI